MVFLRQNRAESECAACDVLVVGGGPAGLSLAAEFARLGRLTTLIDLNLGNPWERSYGSFYSDLLGADVDSAVVRLYERPEVRVDEGPPLIVAESYARLDTSRLQSLLLERAERAGVRLISGELKSVDFVERDGAGRCEVLADPSPGDLEQEPSLRRFRARLVVDASGGRSLRNVDARRPAALFQSALGYWVNAAEHPFGQGDMWLMDFRAVDEREPATFLYAMPETGGPHGPGVVFVQETNLVSESPLSMHFLRDRLHQRLSLMGLSASQVLGTERCVIPMGGALPNKDSLILPFGAAAGLVHPATGYQLARALRLAPVVAEAASSELMSGPGEAARAGVSVMWPQSMRKSFRFYEAGAHAISSLTAEQMRQFVFEFFELPDMRAVRFMAGDMQPEEIVETMWRVFASASSKVRAGLLRGGASASTRMLIQRFS